MANSQQQSQQEPAVEAHKRTLALSELAPGETGSVVEVACGRGLLCRMTSLGFTPGALVTVVQNFGHGPLIALVRDGRIALGRGEARRILVRRNAS
jgi:ferrous iron transport protein A